MTQRPTLLSKLGLTQDGSSSILRPAAGLFPRHLVRNEPVAEAVPERARRS
jgi:hypothetical protein